MFERCEFLLGEGDFIIIVVPAHLPRAETYTVSVTERVVKFLADYNNIAEMEYPGGEIYQRIAKNTQIGLVEFPPHVDDFPSEITNVAYVEIRRAAS